ncbi:hypothetical protein GC176_22100 [bacterium]|nr:hypothetical protein [bacterium]
MQQFSDPPGGKLQIVDQSDSRVVISIPAGGKKARGIGCFAVLWLAITIPISLVFLLVDDADWEGGQAPPFWGMVAFFGLFYAVGFGMLYAWIRMRFTEVLVAVEPGRLTIQRTLFSRKKLKRRELADDARAELAVAYTSNDVPVYNVSVGTTDGDEKFGTALSRDEKQWIVDTINRFLGHETSTLAGLSDDGWPTICDACGGELLTGENKRVCSECGKVFTADVERTATSTASNRDAGRPWGDDGTGQITDRPEPLAPYELSPDSKLTIERDEPECLQFSYRVRLPLIVKVLMGGFLLFFCSFWFGVVFTFLYDILTDPKLGAMRWAFLAFLSVFVVVGFVPLTMFLSLFLGRVRVMITSENLTASIGVGPFRKKKSLACSLIRDVGTGPVGTSRGSGFGSTRTSLLQGVMVRSSDFPLPLTVSKDTQFNNEVAGLVRYQLSHLGYLKPND